MNPKIDFSHIPLRDIHLPGAVGWWPPAVGWWVAAVLLVSAVGFAWYRHRRAYRARAAGKAIKRVIAALDGGEEPGFCAQQMSVVLRRFAMSIEAGRDAVAGLTGRRWLRYLDSRWERESFSAGPGGALLIAPYVPAGRVDVSVVRALGAVCLEWIDAQRARR